MRINPSLPSGNIMPVNQTTLSHAKLLNTITEYDRKESIKRNYNHYALGHYCRGLQKVKAYVGNGHSLRDAIITCFLGSLCNKLLKAVGLPKMTPTEALYGLENPLQQIDID